MRDVVWLLIVGCALACLPSRADAQVRVIGEVGWRYPFLGQSLVPADDGAFPITYHLATSVFVGERVGFYSGVRFDGFGPRGREFPFAATARVGYYFDVHELRPPSVRTSTSETLPECETDGMWRTCTTTRTTSTWYQPAHFVKGMRYVYAGYRHLGFALGDLNPVSGERDATQAGAVALGVGFHGTKIALSGIPFMTFMTEFELWYHVYGWDEPVEERTRLGGSIRAAVLFGPVFVDVTAALDAGFGGELSVGIGAMLTNG